MKRNKHLRETCRNWYIYLLVFWIGIQLTACNPQGQTKASSLSTTQDIVIGTWKESRSSGNQWNLIHRAKADDDEFEITMGNKTYMAELKTITDPEEYKFYSQQMPDSSKGHFTINKNDQIYIVDNYEYNGEYKTQLILMMLPGQDDAYVFTNDIEPKLFEEFNHLIPQDKKKL